MNKLKSKLFKNKNLKEPSYPFHPSPILLQLLLRQQPNKLHPTNNPIAIPINLPKKFPYFLLRSNLILQKFAHLLECYLATVIDIEVTEGLIEMFLFDFFLKIEPSYEKFGVIDETRAVCVKVVFYYFYFLVAYLEVFFVCQRGF